MMVFERLKFQPVNPDDEFQFSCSNCGECCRNIKEAVMVESLDLFRIARYMKLTTAEAMEAYTVPAFLSRGFPILLMKTKQHMNACVFLKDGKCSIHSNKPRTCRLYPLNAGPWDKSKSNFQYFIVSQRPHHFTGRGTASKLDGTHFKPEDRHFALRNTKWRQSQSVDQAK
jgi:Fe-S-cluster containining protein